MRVIESYVPDAVWRLQRADEIKLILNENLGTIYFSQISNIYKNNFTTHKFRPKEI